MSSIDSRVLVVCHGAINRSPMCAAVLRAEGLTNVKVAALKPNGGGERAARKMRMAALDIGLDLEEHRSVKLDTNLLLWAEYVIYMDGGNLRRLGNVADNYRVKEKLPVSFDPLPNQHWIALGQYALPAVHRIPDPAFIKKDTPEFAAVVDLIHKASVRLAAAIRNGEL